MWQVAKDLTSSYPIYFREAISRSRHVALVTISEYPFKIQLFPNTFIDELFRDQSEVVTVCCHKKIWLLLPFFRYPTHITIKNTPISSNPALTKWLTSGGNNSADIRDTLFQDA